MDIQYDNWEIVRKIGAGSSSSVYEIERHDLGVYKAALKVIPIPQHPEEVDEIRNSGMSDEEIVGYYKDIVDEIIREFTLMSKLKGTTNIVSYEDHKVVPHEEGIGWDIYLRMELLIPLDKYITDHPLSERDIALLGVDICRALERCEKLHVIHRDIKPGNILVSEQGDFKLGDFGIARTAERTVSNMSRKGTTSYMAPEVYNGLEYGPTVDIYSLGLVMYRLLNHNRMVFLPPYPEPIRFQDQELALFKRINGAPLPYPNDKESALGEVILKACAYDSQDRYQKPVQFRKALEELLETPGAIADDAEHSDPNPAVHKSASAKKKLPVKLLAICAAVVLAVAIFLAIWIPTHRREEEPVIPTDPAPASFTLENYTGRLLPDAESELTAHGITVSVQEEDSTEPEGMILAQSIAENTEMKKGEELTLTVSKGNQFLLSSFVNRVPKRVKQKVEEAGILVESPYTVSYEKGLDPGRIISIALINPNDADYELKLEEGAVIPKNAALRFYVQGVRIPEDVFLMTEADASKELTSLGLKLNKTHTAYSNAVYGQIMSIRNKDGDRLTSEDILKYGSSVTLYISAGPQPTNQNNNYTEPQTAAPPPADG